MRAISTDLRQRAIDLYRELGSYADVARRLQVRQRWVSAMVRRQQERGSLEPDYANCGNKPKIKAAQEQPIRAWLAEDNDLTLAELQAKLAEQGVRISHTAVAEALTRMKLTRKKRPRWPKNATAPTSRKSARAGSRKR